MIWTHKCLMSVNCIVSTSLYYVSIGNTLVYRDVHYVACIFRLLCLCTFVWNAEQLNHLETLFATVLFYWIMLLVNCVVKCCAVAGLFYISIALFHVCTFYILLLSFVCECIRVFNAIFLHSCCCVVCQFHHVCVHEVVFMTYSFNTKTYQKPRFEWQMPVHLK